MALTAFPDTARYRWIVVHHFQASSIEVRLKDIVSNPAGLLHASPPIRIFCSSSGYHKSLCISLRILR
ncbi:hypothetical protein HanXRQr2_Chr08g0348561 [Helianthus annuus]|uniref:Uncharacterized protein n=1 Tax=Helianthus annuus TaxID=4232 RepID=A0A251U823_HELAN|nr:hypothetical protein HanXRQr2_Chr08g0348561 [Helianthus annuus]